MGSAESSDTTEEEGKYEVPRFHHEEDGRAK